MNYFNMDISKICKIWKLIILTLLYSVLIGILYSIEYFDFISVGLSILFFMLALISSLLFNEFFLFVSWRFIEPSKKFKEILLKTSKALLLSYMILLPISLILFFVYYLNLISIINIAKVIMFIMDYICLIFLFFTYKSITKYDWGKCVLIVAASIIVKNLIIFLLNFI